MKDATRAVAQHLVNLCTIANKTYHGGFIMEGNQIDEKIEAVVGMAYTCGYAVAIYADEFTGDYSVVRVYNMEGGDIEFMSLKGYSASSAMYWNAPIVIERKPHGIK